MTQQDRDEIRQIVRVELDKMMPQMNNTVCNHYWVMENVIGTSLVYKCLKCGMYRTQIESSAATGTTTPPS